MNIFEMIMLICFGAAWPFSIYQSYKSRSTEGKSAFFLIILIIGYLAGITYKLLYNYDMVIYLYILNLFMVVTDLLLYLRNTRLLRRNKNMATY